MHAPYFSQTRITLPPPYPRPAFFGGYLNANYFYLAQAADLDAAQLASLAAASFRASLLLGEPERQRHLADVEAALCAWEAGAPHAARAGRKRRRASKRQKLEP